MQGADIGISTWLVKCDPEASYSRRRLGESDAVLGSRLDQARVRTIGRGIEHRVTRAVGVNGYIRGWRKRILRFSAEGDRVRCDRIIVGPFHCFASMDRDHRIVKAHDRGSIAAASRGYYLAAADGHTVC